MSGNRNDWESSPADHRDELTVLADDGKHRAPQPLSRRHDLWI